MVEFIEYETPTSNLRRLTQQDRSEEFNLVIIFDQDGSRFEVRTTVNKIRVISKTINNLFLIDPTTNEYEIHFPLKISTEEVKILISKLLKSSEEKVLIEKDKEKELNLIQFFLGEMTKDDSAHILINSIKEAISYLNTEAHNSSIEYLSTKFNEIIDNGELNELNEAIIIEIIVSYFQKEKEKEEKSNTNQKEEIFEKLKNKENCNIVMHFLLQIEEEEYTEDMKEYIINNLSDEIVYNELNQIIKNYQKLILTFKPSNQQNNIINIEYTNDELNGIISYMQQTINSNLIENEELKITSGRTLYGSPSNLIKYSSDHINNLFQNCDSSKKLQESEGSIEFDFGKRKINLTSYTIRTSSENTNGAYHPKTWRILGSNDAKEWTLLDQKTNDSCLNGKYKQHRFECSKNSNYYRFIRYIQDDSWYENREYHISLTCIEFFGSILL